MEKLNIAEILKDCPKGMELDCTMFINPVTLDEVINDDAETYPITIVSCTGIVMTLTKYGTYIDEEETRCIIFPKGKTTWEGFVPSIEFKNGDIIYVKDKYKQEWCSIIKNCKDGKLHDYVDICINSNSLYYDKSYILCFYKDIIEYRLATEEEKEKLFRAIKERGYKWNAETKTLEKLIEPKFKVGDTITNGKTSITIGYIDDEYYYEISRNIATRLFIKNQDKWNLVPNKFDISTLKPFDKVLVRDKNVDKWKIDFWGFYDIEYAMNYPYECCGNSYAQCIPYEGNEHLCGTTGDCVEYYKTWK